MIKPQSLVGKLPANQIFWGFVTWGFKPGDKLGGLNNNKITLEITVDNN